MSGDQFDFLQGNKETITGTLHDPQATTGHVLTVQADKSIKAAAGGGSTPVLSARLKLTDAQIKALPGTPLTIVAGVAGKILWPLHSLFICDNSSGNPYAGIGNGASFGVGYPSIFFDVLPGNYMLDDQVSGGGPVTRLFGSYYFSWGAISPGQEANNPASLMATFGYAEDHGESDLDAVIGADLIVALQNPPVNDDLTGGDPANSLIATCLYTLIDPS